MKLKEGMACRVENTYYRQGALSVDLVDAHRYVQAGKGRGFAIKGVGAEIFAGFLGGKGK